MRRMARPRPDRGTSVSGGTERSRADNEIPVQSLFWRKCRGHDFVRASSPPTGRLTVIRPLTKTFIPATARPGPGAGLEGLQRSAPIDAPVGPDLVVVADEPVELALQLSSCLSRTFFTVWWKRSTSSLRVRRTADDCRCRPPRSMSMKATRCMSIEMGLSCPRSMASGTHGVVARRRRGARHQRSTRVNQPSGRGARSWPRLSMAMMCHGDTSTHPKRRTAADAASPRASSASASGVVLGVAGGRPGSIS